MHRDLRLLSPRRFVNLPHLPCPGDEDYLSIPDYENYLREYARHFGLLPKHAEVTSVQRIPEGFQIRCISGSELRCQFLVVATGLFGHPIWPEIPGLAATKGNGETPRILHAGNWAGPNTFAKSPILIIGAGISGVGIAEECAQSGAAVMVSLKSKRPRLVRPRILGRDILDWFRPLEFLPRSFFGSLCDSGIHAPAFDNGYSALVRAGKITELPEVTRVQGKKVSFANGTHREVGVIVVATGYRYETPFLPDEIRRMPGGHPITAKCESPDWPGLFFVGAPCSRRIDSEFLRGIANDAIFVANRIQRKLASRPG